MLRFFRILSVIPVLFICSLSAGAQVLYHLDTLKTTLYFHRNSFVLESDYRGNGEKLQAFVKSVSAVMGNEAQKMLLISGTVGASLNGIAFDERFLCEKRISTLKYVLSKGISIPSSSIHLKNIGQNWKRLEECVVSDQTLSNREEILDIIGKTPVKAYVGDTLARNRVEGLMKIDRGKAWSELAGRFFDEMDVAEILCIYQTPLEVRVTSSVDPAASMRTQTPQLAPDPDDSEDYRRYLNKTAYWMAIRTNLLYDLALVPNIGIEFSVMKTFSIAASWEYAYWTVSSRSLIHKVYGGDLAVRWWFGHSSEWAPLTGHHAGLYGQMAAFDFAQGKSRLSVAPWQWAAGLEYGYTLPLGKGRLAFDFTIGIGYSAGDYNFWTIESGADGTDYYKWENKSHYQYIGPTKAEISLVWRIGIK